MGIEKNMFAFIKIYLNIDKLSEYATELHYYYETILGS